MNHKTSHPPRGLLDRQNVARVGSKHISRVVTAGVKGVCRVGAHVTRRRQDVARGSTETLVTSSFIIEDGFSYHNIDDEWWAVSCLAGIDEKVGTLERKDE